MGLKHLVGYCLLMAGIGITPLFLVFLANSQYYNPLFLFWMGLCAFVFLFSGVFILKKNE
jgi:hypothetical protein